MIAETLIVIVCSVIAGTMLGIGSTLRGAVKSNHMGKEDISDLKKNSKVIFHTMLDDGVGFVNGNIFR